MSIYVYGAGQRGWEYYRIALGHYRDTFVFIDKSEEKQKKGLWGNAVISPDQFKEILSACNNSVPLVIALADEKAIDEVKNFFDDFDSVIEYRCDSDEKKKMIEEDRRNLLYDDFSIISNNCWGGVVYDHFGLQYKSPTIGAFFLSDDYLKFVTGLEKYLDHELDFIRPIDANRYDECKEYISELGNYPIGRIDDINIHFLHSKSEDDAFAKWNRRKERINWNKLIIKNSTQNLWTASEMMSFSKLPYRHKILFTTERINGISDQIVMDDGNERILETDKYMLYFNVLGYLNNLEDDENNS